MEKTDTIICLKKKTKLKEYQKNYREVKKSHNKIVLTVYVVIYAN